MSDTRIGSITIHVHPDVEVQTQAAGSDSKTDSTVSVFVKGEGYAVSVQLCGTPVDLRALGQGIIDKVTEIEQRKLAAVTPTGF